MANEVTILYYSACRISPRFAGAVRTELLRAIATDGWPIISVTHKPVDFGDVRIVVGDVEIPGAWQVYMNALLGARAATTEWIACAEDDSLYTQSHFRHRPAADVFAYNRNRWVITRRLSSDGKRREAILYWRERTQFAQCIARRSLMVDALEERFAKFPTPLPDDVLFPMGFGEPGRYEKNLKLTPRTRQYFDTQEPNITFNHAESIRGRRKVNPDDIIRTDLPPWGNANDLWRRIHG